MRVLSIKTHLLLLTLGISSAIIALIFAILAPTMRQIARLSTDIKVERKRVEAEQRERKNPERSLSELAAVTQQVKKFSHSTVPPGRALELITQLENLADQNRLAQTLRIESSQEQYLFSLTNVGSFADQLRFFRALEQLPAYVIIDKIEWKKPIGSPGDTALSTRFTAKIYAAIP